MNIKELLLELTSKIEEEFGEECEERVYGCVVCDAYHALDTLIALFEADKIKTYQDD